MITIGNIKEALPELCKEFGIKRVEIFGSLARNDQTDDPDIDLIIEFEEPKEENISKRYFGFLQELENRLNRKVDLLTPRSIKNPYLKKTIDRDKITLYG
jgi:hypothetical protein